MTFIPMYHGNLVGQKIPISKNALLGKSRNQWNDDDNNDDDNDDTKNNKNGNSNKKNVKIYDIDGKLS